MTVQEFLDRMNQLPSEVKALELGFFDFGNEDLEWLDFYLENENWKNWSGEGDHTFVIC
jgi:hypothetical protein